MATERLDISSEKLERIEKDARWKCAESCIKAHFEDKKSSTVIKLTNLGYLKTVELFDEALENNKHYSKLGKEESRKFREYIFNNRLKGIPDFLIMPKYGRPYFIEVKSNKGELSKIQLQKIMDIKLNVGLTTYLAKIGVDIKLRHDKGFYITRIDSEKKK